MMLLLPTLAAPWYVTLLTIAFVIVSLFMMLVILIQKPKGGGLSGAFGGAGGSSQSVFGARTGDVLTWVTVFCFVAFIGLAIVLTWTARPDRSVPVTPAVDTGGVGGDTTGDTTGGDTGGDGGGEE